MLQEKIVITVMDTANLKVRRSRDASTRRGHNGIGECEDRLRLKAAHRIKLPVVGNHIYRRVRDCVERQCATLNAIVPGHLLDVRDSCLEPVWSDRTPIAICCVEAFG